MTTPLASGASSAGSTSSTPEQVRQLFNPRSIALIGATDKSRWSWNIFGNLQLHGFGGPVYLVVASLLGDISDWGALLAIVAFIAGGVTLFLRMSDRPRDDDDDGAVL